MSRRYASLLLAAASLSACAKPPLSGVITSDERRIWVVRSGEEVFRCADGAKEDQPPKPVCVRAPMVGAPE